HERRRDPGRRGRVLGRRRSGRRVKARKRFGQHFLERPWVERLVEAIDPHPDEIFLEIGPGRGALTQALLDRGATVHAVEIDRDLAAGLTTAPHPRLHGQVGDLRETPDRTGWAGARPDRGAANLPS